MTSAEESVKKPSLLSRFKNKLTGKPEAELSPEREVFEESETDDETEEPKFFDEDTTLYLESEEEKRLREEAEERLKAEQLPEPPSRRKTTRRTKRTKKSRTRSKPFSDRSSAERSIDFLKPDKRDFPPIERLSIKQRSLTEETAYEEVP